MVEEQSTYDEGKYRRFKLGSVSKPTKPAFSPSLKSLSQRAFFKYREKILMEFQRMTSMDDAKLQEKVQKYINIYRNTSSKYLSPEIGQQIRAVGFDNGVLIDIEAAPAIANSDVFFEDVNTISEALSLLKINFNASSKYKKQVDANKRPTAGTYIGFDETLLIIKGRENKFWTTEQLQQDISTILKEVEMDIADSEEKKVTKNTIRNDKKG